MRRTLLFAILFILPVFAVRAEDRDLHAPTTAEMTSEARVALVIGNGAYPSGPLKNPPNDAKAIAAKLQELGFDVTLLTDLDYQSMNRALIEFGQKLKAGGVGLFYYAGHGLQSGGHNYLVPVNATIPGEAYIRAEAVDVDLVLAGMAEAHNRVNLVILDACRNNPFERSFRSGSQGLGAPANTPRGTLVAYATGPGSVAEDGAGQHSTYTQGLLDTLGNPGVKVEEVFKTVRSRVEAATDGKQTPWEMSSLTGDFYFRISGNSTAMPSAASSNPKAAEPAPNPFAKPVWGQLAQAANDHVGGYVKDNDLPGLIKLSPSAGFADCVQCTEFIPKSMTAIRIDGVNIPITGFTGVSWVNVDNGRGKILPVSASDKRMYITGPMREHIISWCTLVEDRMNPGTYVAFDCRSTKIDPRIRNHSRNLSPEDGRPEEPWW